MEPKQKEYPAVDVTGDRSKIQCCKEQHCIRSDQISHSVVSESLRPHESQHARPPCPSPTPGVDWHSCPSSQWYHPAISSSVVPFFSCPQSLPASESFPMSQLFAWGGQSSKMLIYQPGFQHWPSVCISTMEACRGEERVQNEIRLFLLPAGCPWARALSSLRLSLCICKMKLIAFLQGLLMSNKWYNIFENLYCKL